MYYLQGHHTAPWQKFRPFRTQNKRDHLTLGCIILFPRARPCLRLPLCTSKRGNKSVKLNYSLGNTAKDVFRMCRLVVMPAYLLDIQDSICV